MWLTWEVEAEGSRVQGQPQLHETGSQTKLSLSVPVCAQSHLWRGRECACVCADTLVERKGAGDDLGYCSLDDIYLFWDRVSHGPGAHQVGQAKLAGQQGPEIHLSVFVSLLLGLQVPPYQVAVFAWDLRIKLRSSEVLYPWGHLPSSEKVLSLNPQRLQGQRNETVHRRQCGRQH